MTTKRMSQNAKIRIALERGARITWLDAYKRGWGSRLSGRIYDLRKLGLVIESTPVKVKTQDGTTTVVSQYRLAR